jgi:hypothetical protein
MVGVFNAAVWLGSAVFFTFCIAPAVFSPAMKRIFGDYYVGVIAQQLIGSYFTVNLICGCIALGHLLVEFIYNGKGFRKVTFGILLGVLGLGLLGGEVFAPKIKQLHQVKYRGTTPDARTTARTQLSRLHAVSMMGNLLSLAGIVVYTFQLTRPAEQTRFTPQQKFRG